MVRETVQILRKGGVLCLGLCEREACVQTDSNEEGWFLLEPCKPTEITWLDFIDHIRRLTGADL